MPPRDPARRPAPLDAYRCRQAGCTLPARASVTVGGEKRRLCLPHVAVQPGRANVHYDGLSEAVAAGPDALQRTLRDTDARTRCGTLPHGVFAISSPIRGTTGRRTRALESAFAAGLCAGCPLLYACGGDAVLTRPADDTHEIRGGMTQHDRAAARARYGLSGTRTPPQWDRAVDRAVTATREALGRETTP